MKRPYTACRYVCGSLATVTAMTSALPMTTIVSTSSANFDMRGQMVDLTRILNVSDYTGQVTKGDFTKMLVNTSSYRGNLPAFSVSVFADVPSTYPDVIYANMAVPQGWMTGFLGGLFKPEKHITYKDAVKAALTMLGHSDEDSTGDLALSRISKLNYPELNGEINRQPEEVLNQTDCMNIFYSLLKTKKKDNSEIYGAILDCELNSDEEVNPVTILDDEHKDPILMRKGFGVIQLVPPGSENANVSLNGTASTLEAMKVSQQDAGLTAIYYGVKSKTIQVYTTRRWDDDDLEGGNVYALLRGEVKNIYYKSMDVMTPTSIRLEIGDDSSDGGFGEDGIDEDGYLTISLSSSEPQYPFSIYGGIEVGDEVVMVRNKGGGSYTATDAIEC